MMREPLIPIARATTIAIGGFIVAFEIGACDSTTDSGAGAVDMRGEWSYTATQTAPALSIEGLIRIDQQDGADFSGTAEFSETDVQGTVRNRTGQLSGRVIGSDAVDFDIFMEEAARRHVASVAADSMNGTWARTASNPPVTGSFRARRIQ